MYIDPTNASTHEAMPLDERHDFFIFRDRHGWQSLQRFQNLRATVQGTTCQLADNKRVTMNFGATKKRNEPWMAAA
jgi:hypothetical protein